MRRSLTVLPIAAIAVAVALAGCAGSDNTSKGDPASSTGCAKSGSASDAVKVSGDFGSEPKVDLGTKLTAKTTERTVVIKGDGDKAITGSQLIVNFAAYDATTGKQLVKYSDAKDQPIVVDATQTVPGLARTLLCAQVGERVVGVIPPADAFGSTGEADLGIGADETLVFVFDVTKAVGPAKAVDWTTDLPTVTRDAKNIPTVKLPAGDPPKTLELTVLKKGTGATVKSGDNVTVDYQGTSWNTKQIFDQSFGKTPATFVTSGVIPGFTAALVGQKVGSTVMVTIPPEYAYGTDTSQQLGGQTLLFVIDIEKTAAAG